MGSHTGAKEDSDSELILLGLEPNPKQSPSLSLDEASIEEIVVPPLEEYGHYLPPEVSRAAADGNEEAVLEWLGLPPVPTCRMQATYQGNDLLHQAVGGNHRSLINQLLQLGANVDAKNSRNLTPLEHALCLENNSSVETNETAQLLLLWGAHADLGKLMLDVKNSNSELLELLQTALGGRRCEIVELKGCQSLNGQTGVVVGYRSLEQAYVLEMEETHDLFSLQPTNLRRRDRSPTDCGVCFRFPSILPRPSENLLEEWSIFHNEMDLYLL